jgi:membrane-associated PAP2 superfamily phosphatase
MPILRRNKGKDDKAAATGRPAVAKRSGSGRATPKGTASGRYTPPIPKEYRRSPTWVPVLMLTLLIAGMVTIISNYLPGAGFLPGDSNNWYLLLGLGLITLGFITATKYH